MAGNNPFLAAAGSGGAANNPFAAFAAKKEAADDPFAPKKTGAHLCDDVTKMCWDTVGAHTRRRLCSVHALRVTRFDLRFLTPHTLLCSNNVPNNVLLLISSTASCEPVLGGTTSGQSSNNWRCCQ